MATQRRFAGRVDHVLAKYPLGVPRVVERFEASSRNDNWLIQDEKGSRYVLRRHRQHREAERIAFQLSFEQHLHRRGFPTPQVLETVAGDAFVLGDDGPWSLYEYVDGTFFRFDRPGEVVEAARRLAQFHLLAETFDSEDVIVDYSPPIRSWWVDPESDLEALRHLLAGRAVDEELAYVRDWWQWVLVAWPLARIDALPMGWVHADYHGRNVVFVENKIRALFDFDDLNRGPMIFDVARGVHMFGRESRSSPHIRPDVARYFVREYGHGRALTAEELSALPMMVAMYYPPSARYYRYCQQLGEDLEARLRREVSLMRALRAQMAEITAIATSI